MSGQTKYMLLILSIALLFSCSRTFADENTKLHVGANFVGTLAVYQFLNLMGKAGCSPEYGLRRSPGGSLAYETQTQKCENKKEFLLLAAPLLFTTGLLIEATQAQERNRGLDIGDVAANALGVGLAVGCVFAFDF